MRNDILKVIERYSAANGGSILPWTDKLSFVMDLAYSRMDVAKLLTFGGMDFIHDLQMLWNEFDRETLSFVNLAMPRCGLLEAA